MVSQSGPGYNEGELDRDLLELLGRQSDVVFLLDNRCTIQFAGTGTGSLLGYEPVDVVGESFTEFILSETASERGESDTEASANSIVEGWTERSQTVETAGGTSVPVEVSTVAIGSQSTVICLLDDVRDHRQHERERERYGDFIDAVGDPMYVLNEQRVIEEVNDALATYSGYTRTELSGRDIEEIFSGREHGEVLAQLSNPDDTPNGPSSESFETTLVTRTGTLKRSEISVTAVTDEQGACVGYIGVVRDIGDHKQRERDLELLKTVFSRVLRHNVRNELNAMLAHVELLDEQVESPLQEHTQTILNAASRLLDHGEKARLIEQVIESTELKELDLAVEIDRALEAVETGPHNPVIEVDVPGGETVEAHSRLSAAIEELIDNAIRHTTDEATPRVTLWTESQAEFVTLFVQDESGGLAEHELEVLRSGREEDLKHGSGVGLWLIRWIVEYSGADLIAHRTENGTLMGIRFLRPGRADEAARVGFNSDSPFVRTPARFVDKSGFKRSHGETIVGRMDELYELEDTYETVERTGGHLVFVEGPSGAGKTTLVDEFCDRLNRHEIEPVVARGICSPDFTPPYHLIGQVLEELPVSTTLEEVLAGVSSFTDDDLETVNKRRQTLFSDIVTELREVAVDQPLVLVFEDLHRANRATVDLLNFLFDEVGRWSLPIMFVCTYRTPREADDLVGGWSSSDANATPPARYEDSPIVQFAKETETIARSRRLELEPLERTDVEHLLEKALDDPVPASLVQSVHDHSGGNPLFVSELGKHLSTMLFQRDTPRTVPTDLDDGDVLASLERIVLERLDELPSSARSTLELGAVIGEWFSLDVLLEASDVSETELLEAVEVLVGNHFLVRDEEFLRFSHAVIRDQVREQLDTERSLHGRVAMALETVYEERLEEQYARLGNHYERAGDFDKAVEYYRRAGDQAKRAYAHDVALIQYERALTLAREHGLLEEGAVVSLLADVAEVQSRTGDFDSARETTHEALDHVDENTRVQCHLLGICAEAQSGQGEYELAREKTARQQGVAKAIDAKEFQAESLRRLGQIAKERGEYDEALTQYQAGLDIAREVDDRHREATNLHGLGMVSWRQGNNEIAQKQFERSLDIAREVGDRQLVAASLSNLGIVFQYQGKYETARDYFEQSLEIAREIGDRQRESGDQNNLGIVAVHQGDYETARTHHEESLEIKRAIGDRSGIAKTLNNLGEVFRYQGAYETARKNYEDSRDIHRELDNQQGETISLINLGEVERECDNLQAARESYEAGLELAQAIESPRLEAHALLGLAKTVRRQGDAELGVENLTRARELFEETGDRSGIAKTELEAGRNALVQGDITQARNQAETARELFVDLGDQHLLGRARRLLGRIERQDDNHTEANVQFREALETYEELDAVNDALKTLKELLSLTREREQPETTREFLRQAQELAADAPPATASKHAKWLEEVENELT